MAVSLQELLEEERMIMRPLIHFLRQRMEVDSLGGRWTKFKERFGCCGGVFRMTINTVHSNEDDDDEDDANQPLNLNHTPSQDGSSTNPGWTSLAMALAAEREFRDEKQPCKASLMRLMEDTEDVQDRDGEGDVTCCVCMTRRRGAAFIPCGHTFCRTCAREVWVRRGTCPLCNEKIHEVLHIY